MSDRRLSAGLFQAFVLHRRDYGDTSLLVELFAAGLGRFPAIAKGARRRRNPASALLQPFQPLWIGVVGRGEVRTLTRVEPAGRALPLVGQALPCGLYLNELLNRLLGRHDPQDPLFAFYHAALAGLTGEDLETALRQFELRLLEELGYAPGLGRDGQTGLAVEANHTYVVDPGQAPRRALPEESLRAVRGGTLLALAGNGSLDVTQRREARGLLRRLLDPHLGPRPLKSRELFHRLSASEGRSQNPVNKPGNPHD
jgi:DNA repair protein RecO (recombination protein O)